MDATPRVLLVEDNPAEARLIRELLAVRPGHPCSLEWADRLASGLVRLGEQAFDLVLLDLMLPDASGLEGLRAIRAHSPGVPVVVLTGLADEEIADEALQGGAQDYLFKHRINPDALARSIRYAIERQRAEHALREREAQLRRLQLVTDGTLAHLGPDELLDALLGRVQEALDVEAAAILLVDEERGELVRTATRGLGDMVDGRIPIGQGFAGRIAAERRVMAVEDLAVVDLASLFLSARGIRALLGAPLVARQRLLGVIGVGLRRPHRFTADQVHLLELVAHRVAPAIEMARLHRELEQAVEMRDHVLAVAAHDLRGPLTAIRLRAQFARDRAREAPSSGIEVLIQHLGQIERATTGMARLIDDLVDAAELQLGQVLALSRTVGDLADIVRGVIAEFKERSDDRQPITFDGSANLIGSWDQPRLERVVRNLLENAIKYSPHGGEIVVNLTRDERGQGALLAVRDHGIGIPAADLPHIFHRFHRAANVSTIPGTGIGLAGAQQIVEQHGGRIEVESRERVGSTFTVWLPLLPAVAAR